VDAIRYVLSNSEHHSGATGIDPCISIAPQAAPAAAEPKGRLLKVGWCRGRWPKAGPPPGSRYALARNGVAYFNEGLHRGHRSWLV
jgi:hypothetical protein